MSHDTRTTTEEPAAEPVPTGTYRGLPDDPGECPDCRGRIGQPHTVSCGALDAGDDGATPDVIWRGLDLDLDAGAGTAAQADPLREPPARREYLRALRDLDDLLAGSPGLPAPMLSMLAVYLGGSPAEQVDELNRVAVLLDVAPVSHEHFVSVRRDFGAGVCYEVMAFGASPADGSGPRRGPDEPVVTADHVWDDNGICQLHGGYCSMAAES